jgi:hypothetical protein
MGILGRLRSISGRWDTPEMPRQQRGTFGVVLLSCLTIAIAGGVSLVWWNILPLLYFTGPFLIFAGGGTYRHLRGPTAPKPSPSGSWPAEPALRPSQPADALDDPWRPPAR